MPSPVLNRLTVLLLGLWLGAGLLPRSAKAQGNLPSPNPSAPSQPAASSPVSPRDTLKTTQGSKDSTTSRAALLSKSRADSVQVVKHDFNHRQQIITGSVVMTCLALIMVTMNNYNPR